MAIPQRIGRQIMMTGGISGGMGVSAAAGLTGLPATGSTSPTASANGQHLGVDASLTSNAQSLQSQFADLNSIQILLLLLLMGLSSNEDKESSGGAGFLAGLLLASQVAQLPQHNLQVNGELNIYQGVAPTEHLGTSFDATI